VVTKTAVTVAPVYTSATAVTTATDTVTVTVTVTIIVAVVVRVGVIAGIAIAVFVAVVNVVTVGIVVLWRKGRRGEARPLFIRGWIWRGCPTASGCRGKRKRPVYGVNVTLRRWSHGIRKRKEVGGTMCECISGLIFSWRKLLEWIQVRENEGVKVDYVFVCVLGKGKRVRQRTKETMPSPRLWKDGAASLFAAAKNKSENRGKGEKKMGGKERKGTVHGLFVFVCLFVVCVSDVDELCVVEWNKRTGCCTTMRKGMN
jgi:hypothetical protein